MMRDFAERAAKMRAKQLERQAIDQRDIPNRIQALKAEIAILTKALAHREAHSALQKPPRGARRLTSVEVVTFIRERQTVNVLNLIAALGTKPVNANLDLVHRVLRQNSFQWVQSGIWDRVIESDPSR